MRKIFLLLISVSLVLFGCYQSKIEKLSTLFGSEKRNITIGVSFPDEKTDRWNRDEKVISEEVKSLGYQYISKSAGNKHEQQVKDIEEMIRLKADVIIIGAVDAVKLGPVVNKASEKGVLIIAYDRLILNAKVDYYVTFDNVKVGKQQAEYLNQYAKKGNLIFLSGSQNDNNTFLFRDGAKEVLSNSKFKIVKDEFCVDWKGEEAYKHVKAVLAKGIPITAILAPNDNTAGAAIEALAEYKLKGKVEVTGQDADLSALRRIAKGEQGMTVFKNTSLLAKVAVTSALAMARNNRPLITSYTDNGKYKVPTNLIDTVAVNKQNLKEKIVAGGFYTEAEIYQ